MYDKKFNILSLLILNVSYIKDFLESSHNTVYEIYKPDDITSKMSYEYILQLKKILLIIRTNNWICKTY
jgi:hypothetical protein